MKTIVIIICLLTAGVVRAEDNSKWTPLDTGLQLTYTAVHVMDWCQTLRIGRDLENYYEKVNPYFLTAHPLKKRVNAYFASTLILHTAISYVLPKPYRTVWQTVWIGIEYEQVQRNREIGLGISLRF